MVKRERKHICKGTPMHECTIGQPARHPYNRGGQKSTGERTGQPEAGAWKTGEGNPTLQEYHSMVDDEGNTHLPTVSLTPNFWAEL